MNTPTIQHTGFSEGDTTGAITIPGKCPLEDLYQHSHFPEIIKETLEKHVSWQLRCETQLHLALNMKNQFLPFRAAMAVFGIGDIQEEDSVTLTVDHALTGSSMARPTPAHTPIVASFARVHTHAGSVKECKIALCGIEKRRLSIPDASVLVDKPLTTETIASFARSISEQYPGYSDFNGSTEYRKEMVKVTLERALMQCAKEAGNE